MITVHSRRAASEVMDMVGESLPGTVILHWFSGSLQITERALERGLFFSVNPSMLTNEKARRLVAKIPLCKLLTESDGPFIGIEQAPVRPRDVERVVTGLAELKGLDQELIADTLFGNLRAALAVKPAEDR